LRVVGAAKDSTAPPARGSALGARATFKSHASTTLPSSAVRRQTRCLSTPLNQPSPFTYISRYNKVLNVKQYAERDYQNVIPRGIMLLLEAKLGTRVVPHLSRSTSSINPPPHSHSRLPSPPRIWIVSTYCRVPSWLPRSRPMSGKETAGLCSCRCA
jgi:hypothetical protein